MSGKQESISIWFFIGSLLAFYGLLILGYGVYALVWPPATRPVLAELHADVWWGALLVAVGVFYCIKFFPKRAK
jgi:uncharacterized membrane protein HdeD (DUF308 family)